MSIVAKVIAQSDRADRFLGSAELTQLQDFLMTVVRGLALPKS